MKYHVHPSMVLAFVLVSGSAAGCHGGLVDTDSAEFDVDCPPEHCGVNASTLNDLSFGELHLVDGFNHGLANSSGLHISGFAASRGPGHILRADKGRLTMSDGDQTLEGDDLVGSVITISSTTSDEITEVLIDGYRSVPSWTEDGFAIDQYQLEVLDSETGVYQSACTDSNIAAGHEAGWVVVITRERYSLDDIAIAASGPDANGWFNVVCLGHALAKMKLLGFDPDPRANNPYSSSVSKRQATIKMLAGDYCGTGESFTRDGTPVYWQNQAGWSNNNPPADTRTESLWDLEGALCINTPRLGAEYLDAIQSECAAAGKTLEPCEGDMGTFLWTSSLPAVK